MKLFLPSFYTTPPLKINISIIIIIIIIMI